jgi:hypothetical protein
MHTWYQNQSKQLLFSIHNQDYYKTNIQNYSCVETVLFSKYFYSIYHFTKLQYLKKKIHGVGNINSRDESR